MESPSSPSYFSDADSAGDSAARSSAVQPVLAMSALNSKHSRHDSQFEATASASVSPTEDTSFNVAGDLQSHVNTKPSSSSQRSRQKPSPSASEKKRGSRNDNKRSRTVKTEKLVCRNDPIVVIVYIFLQLWLILIAICLSCVYSGLGVHVELVELDYNNVQLNYEYMELSVTWSFGWLYSISNEDNIFDVGLQALGKEPDEDMNRYATTMSADFVLSSWCGIFFGLMQCLCLTACVGLLFKLILSYAAETAKRKKKHAQSQKRDFNYWTECKKDCDKSGCCGNCFVWCVDNYCDNPCESCELLKGFSCVECCVECHCCCDVNCCPLCSCFAKFCSCTCCCSCKLFCYYKYVSEKLKLSMPFLLILTTLSAILWEDVFFESCVSTGVVNVSCQIDYGIICCYFSVAIGVIVMCLFPVYTAGKNRVWKSQNSSNVGKVMSVVANSMGDGHNAAQEPVAANEELQGLTQSPQPLIVSSNLHGNY